MRSILITASVFLFALPVAAQSISYAAPSEAEAGCIAAAPANGMCPTTCTCAPSPCDACGDGGSMGCGTCEKDAAAPATQLAMADIPVPPDNSVGFGGIDPVPVLTLAAATAVRITMSGLISFSEPSGDFCGNPIPPNPNWGAVAGPFGSELDGSFYLRLELNGNNFGGFVLENPGDPSVAIWEGTLGPGELAVARTGGGSGCSITGDPPIVGHDLSISGMQTIVVETAVPDCETTVHEWCSQCGDDADCDNGLVCDGAEVCVDGACEDGVAPDCIDTQSCTVDTCVEPTGCSNVVVDLDTCSCSAGNVDVAADFNPPVPSPAADCPAVMGQGTFGAEVELSGSFMKQEANCANNCTAQTQAELSVAAVAKVCAVEVAVEGTGMYNYAAQLCPACDESNCEATCESGGCETEGGSGEVSLEVTKFFGQNVSLEAGPLSFSAKCGANLGGEVSLSAGGSVSTGVGQCVACGPDCTTSDVAGEMSGSASLDCVLEAEGSLGIGATFGCDECAAVAVTGTLGGSTSSGDCGSANCNFARLAVEGTLRTPKTEFQALWWSVETECEVGYRACAEANSCGTCACDAEGSCSSLGSTEGGCRVLGFSVQ